MSIRRGGEERFGASPASNRVPTHRAQYAGHCDSFIDVDDSLGDVIRSVLVVFLGFSVWRRRTYSLGLLLNDGVEALSVGQIVFVGWCVFLGRRALTLLRH